MGFSIKRFINKDYRLETVDCTGNCEECTSWRPKKERNDCGKKRKEKWLRGSAAILQWSRTSEPAVVGALYAMEAPLPLIGEIHEENFSHLGRREHPLTSRFLALEMLLSTTIRSENELSKTLTSSSNLSSNLGFIPLNKEYEKTPHNRVFTSARRMLIPRIHDIHEEHVKIALKEGIIDARIVFLDTTHVDLCKKCRHNKYCQWIVSGIMKFSDDCMQYRYENARPGYKRKKKRFLGYKKVSVVDMISGLPLASLTFPGDTADGKTAIPLLDIITDMDIPILFILMDGAFDWEEICRLCNEDINAIPIVPLREGNIATRFPITLEDGQGIFISPCGTPICKGNHPMEFLGLSEDGNATIWGCPSERMREEHMEDGFCLYHGCSSCSVMIRPSMDYRRISIPPRISRDWLILYSMRGIGEGVYSHHKQNLSLEDIRYTSFASVDFHLTMVDIVSLSCAIIANKLGLPRYMRTLKELRRIIETWLLNLPLIRFHCDAIGGICQYFTSIGVSRPKEPPG